jgi:hypothetical protein
MSHEAVVDTAVTGERSWTTAIGDNFKIPFSDTEYCNETSVWHMFITIVN